MIYSKLNQVEYSKNEGAEMLAYFKANYSMFNDIKEYLVPSKFDYATVNDNGEIEIKNKIIGSTDRFKDCVKKLYRSEFPQPSIGCSRIFKKKSVEFLFYYDSNRMLVGYVYSEADFSNNLAYRKIAENWYFLERGMV